MLYDSGSRHKTAIWVRYSAGMECHNQMELLGFCSSFYVPFPLQSHALGRMGCFIFNASME